MDHRHCCGSRIWTDTSSGVLVVSNMVIQPFFESVLDSLEPDATPYDRRPSLQYADY